MKTPAETKRITASGSRWPRTMPTMIPRLSATTIPAVVPNSTATGFVYLTARLMVASWVLSLREEEGDGHGEERAGRARFVLPSSVSPRIVHNPKRMKERAATTGDDLQWDDRGQEPARGHGEAWLTRVATKTAARTVGAGNHIANAMARSWVLSPISARVTKRREATKAVIWCLSFRRLGYTQERLSTKDSRQASRVGTWARCTPGENSGACGDRVGAETDRGESPTTWFVSDGSGGRSTVCVRERDPLTRCGGSDRGNVQAEAHQSSERRARASGTRLRHQSSCTRWIPGRIRQKPRFVIVGVPGAAR